MQNSPPCCASARNPELFHAPIPPLPLEQYLRLNFSSGGVQHPEKSRISSVLQSASQQQLTSQRSKVKSHRHSAVDFQVDFGGGSEVGSVRGLLINSKVDSEVDCKVDSDVNSVVNFVVDSDVNSVVNFVVDSVVDSTVDSVVDSVVDSEVNSVAKP